MDVKKILKIKGLKYWVAAAAFLVVILFLDPNGLPVTLRLGEEVHELHNEEEDLKKAIVQDSVNAAQLSQSPDAMEHYGRENYYMKRPDEDIFVVKQ